MELVVVKDYEELSRRGSESVRELLGKKDNAILGLATGSTPLGLYRELVRMNRNGVISFRNVTTFNLDEYYPIKKTDEQSYRYFMNENLFNLVDIEISKTHMLDGEAEDAEEECASYEKLIEKSGGIDLQILGIGRNGHIAFNEPGPFLYSHTHKTELSESTIEANSRFFSSSDLVPRHSLTMGMGTILGARKIVLIASGKDKKDAVKRMLDGKLDTMCPATLLALHKNVTVIVTEDVLE